MNAIKKALSAFRDFLFLATRHWVSALGVILVTVAALSFSVQAKLFASVSPYLFSPFLLFYAFMMFRGDIGDIGFS